jgi:two-component sensor histidine kinase
LDRCMAGHAPFESEYRVVWHDGSVHWLATRGLFLYDDQGVPARLIGIVMDITERKQAEEQLKASVAEKENLLRELSHRTKNNMQVIANLLNLQAAQSKDRHVTVALSEAQDRIRTMALVHEKLYKGGNVFSLNVKEYGEDLAKNLLKAHQGCKGSVKLSLELEEICLPHDMVLPMGLILNELVSNSLKHAFPAGRQGSIFLSIRRLGQELEVRYKDEGPGMPEGFDLSRLETLGLRLVRTLAVQQLRGKIELLHNPGTEFVFRFPLRATKSDSSSPLID